MKHSISYCGNASLHPCIILCQKTGWSLGTRLGNTKLFVKVYKTIHYNTQYVAYHKSLIHKRHLHTKCDRKTPKMTYLKR